MRKAEAYCLLRRAVAENWTVRVKGSLDGHTPGGMPHRPPTPDSQAESPRQVCYSHVRASPWTEWYRHEAEVDYPQTLKP